MSASLRPPTRSPNLRRWRRLPPCPKAHPLVRQLFREMNRQQVGVLDLADRSGVNKNTITKWRTRDVPQLEGLKACFNVLGLDLVVAPLGLQRRGGRISKWPTEALFLAARLWARGFTELAVLDHVMSVYPELDEQHDSSDSGFISVRRAYPELFPPHRPAQPRASPVAFASGV